jgi:hypothetical protein
MQIGGGGQECGIKNFDISSKDRVDATDGF